MNPRILVFPLLIVSLVSCDRPKKPDAVLESNIPAKSDVPLLPVTKGDAWVYKVHLEIPENVTSPGAAEVIKPTSAPAPTSEKSRLPSVCGGRLFRNHGAAIPG